MLDNKISWKAGMAIVMANMIGTGVFTSLGFQLLAVTNTWSIIILWGLGALMAIAGAFTYSELGTKLKRSGGEYHFLSATYHPLVGYLSGWTSLIIGFAAPIALASMALGAYVQKYISLPPHLIAIMAVLSVSFLHTFDLNKSSIFQNWTTYLKVLLIIIFVLLGLLLPAEDSGFSWGSSWKNEILLPSFAVSLVYVSYSYSGWNAAAYIVDEIRDVKRNLPIALTGGTIIVSVLYILLQIVFLKQVNISELEGKIEIGQIVAIEIFGYRGGQLVSGVIGFMLISSISAMVWVGPRVTKVMAKDYRIWSFLSRTNTNKVPVRAIWLQAALSIVMILTGSFDQILTYSGFILQLFVTMTVIGLFIVRRKGSLKGFKSPLFPIPQIIFLIISIWILVYLSVDQTS
ncbi:MAG: amino acid permease, partial [Bacteroidota bacterium]